MNDGKLPGPINQVGALAALLNAIAESADDARGRRRWDSLARLINGKMAVNSGQPVSGIVELAALKERSGDTDRAEALATTMLMRAATDSGFRKKLAAWRIQKQNQELESGADAGRPDTIGTVASVPARPEVSTSTTAKLTEPSPELNARLQVVLAAVSVVASLLGLRWPLFQAIALAVIPVAIAVAWYHLRHGHSWRDRPVLIPSAACLVAAVVLVLIYVGAKPTSPYAAGAAQALNALPVPPAGSTVPATAANAPARVEGVTPMYSYDEATASTRPISATQLASLNAALASGSPKLHQIFASLNAVAIAKGSADVTVVGNEKSTVTIIGMQVVKHCQEPLNGTGFLWEIQGVNDTMPVDFDLDSSFGSDASNPFPRKVVTLAPGETFTFTVSAETSEYYCQFSFLMMVATAKGTVIEKINNNGKPFALTAEAQEYKVFYFSYGGHAPYLRQK
jgi:hypothetical protein